MRLHLLDNGKVLCKEMADLPRDQWPRKEASMSVKGFKEAGKKAPLGYDACKACVEALTAKK